MPTPITESLLGGWVTSSHPALLDPGELQKAEDCVYRVNDSSIQKAPGRTEFNSTAFTKPGGASGTDSTFVNGNAATSGIKGLAYLSFDSNDDQILAFTEGATVNSVPVSYCWSSSFTSLSSGSFAVITGPGTVTSCIRNGTTTISHLTEKFRYMLVGARLWGSVVPSGTHVVSVAGDFKSIVVSNTIASGADITITFDVGIPFAFGENSTDILDTIQWQDSYFLLTRNGPIMKVNWRDSVSAGGSTPSKFTMRRAGMTPVTGEWYVTTEAGPAWSTVLGAGYYWFLITELIYDNTLSTATVESAYMSYNGKPKATQITTPASQYIKITFPTLLANNGDNGTNRATNWGIYMAVLTSNTAAYPDNTTPPPLNTFRRICIVDGSETFKNIKYTGATQSGQATVTAAEGGGIPEFTNPAGMLKQDGTYGVGVSGGAPTQAEFVKTFVDHAGNPFVTGAPFNGYTVTGVRVQALTRTPNDAAGLFFAIDTGTGVAGTRSAWTDILVANTWDWRWITFGGQFQNWGLTLTPASFSSTFGVHILKSYSIHTQTIHIEEVFVTVYYDGASVDTGTLSLDGPAYQVVTYRSQIGTTATDPANYLIPKSSTGDVFNGSLVVNDIAFPSYIRYSLPGFPESFPKPYEMKFNSKKKDIVTFIRKVGQILVVGMRDSIKRVNYLPTEVDVDFGRGLAHEDIVIDHGVVGPHAGALCDLTGTGVVLVYASYNGFHYTDGIMTRPLNLDIRITDIVKSSALGSSIIKIYPKERWIVFFYCPIGAVHDKNSRAIIFNYAQDKIKEGGFLPATGPIKVSAHSSCEALLGGSPVLLTGHQDNGKIYVEDNGTTLPTGYVVPDSSSASANIAAPITPRVRTRRFFPSGFDRDARGQRIYVLHDEHGSKTNIAGVDVTVIGGLNVLNKTAGWATITQGMLCTGPNVPPGTIVISKTADTVTLSAPLPATQAGQTYTFDPGTIAVSVRGAGVDEAVTSFNTYYYSTTTGDLLVSHNDSMKQGLEVQIDKVVLPNGTQVDVDGLMDIHNITILATDAGQESNRRG